jgi:hypothetical protein
MTQVGRGRIRVVVVVGSALVNIIDVVVVVVVGGSGKVCVIGVAFVVVFVIGRVSVVVG